MDQVKLLALSGSLRAQSRNSALLRAAAAVAPANVAVTVYGVPGALKNALDWLVAGEEFVHKPIALWNASPRAAHAQAALAEIVSTMSGRIVSHACIAVPLLGTALTAAQIAAVPDWRSLMQDAMRRFAQAIAGFRTVVGASV